MTSNVTCDMDFKQVHHIRIDAANHNQRIDNFLFSYLKKVPKGMVYKLIRKGQVRVNSRRVKPTSKLQSGDLVRIPPVFFATKKLHNPKSHMVQLIEQAILFENEDFIVLNKPAGLSVHAGSDTELGVIEILKSSERPFAELVHRLDKQTSGCLLVAKSRICLNQLQAGLKSGDFNKQYLALTYGHWQKRKTKVCKPIAQWKNRQNEKFMKISEQGKYAESVFYREKQFQHWSLVKVDIKTGRTHQIRLHAASEGHALAGDNKYAHDKVKQQAKQDNIHFMCLHAQQLGFKLEAQNWHFTAPLPQRFEQLLEKLN